MTDDILDKLSDEELTEEEHEALLLRSEHAIGPPLSFAAQAVLDAFNEGWWYPEDITEFHIAAALRAAADQVVPEYETTAGGSKIWPSEPMPSIRQRFLAIAAELEAFYAD